MGVVSDFQRHVFCQNVEPSIRTDAILFDEREHLSRFVFGCANLGLKGRGELGGLLSSLDSCCRHALIRPA